MSRRRRPPPHRVGRAGLAGLLALALLASQWLGLLHRSVHAWERGAAAPTAVAGADLGAEAPELAPADAWLKALLGGHGDPRGCRLYDHAASGDAGLGAPLRLPAGAPPALAGWTPHFFVTAAPPPLFRARAPPLPRG